MSTTKFLILLCIGAVLCALVAARYDRYDHYGHGHRGRNCGRHNRNRCCRQRIDYGGCHRHVRRWAYNVTCGRCVPFDWSGCGGDENNFSCQDDCEGCCKGMSACSKFALPKPPSGCEYKWSDGPDGCPRPKLHCTCPKTTCKPDSCRGGERCIPDWKPCNTCPCPQYRCETDPCYAVAKQLRPCEKCVSAPAPACQHAPCPLVAHRENHCPAPPTPAPELPKCQHHVPCPPTGTPCHARRCPRYPDAVCVVDPCDCRKHTWYVQGHPCSDSECVFGRRR